MMPSMMSSATSWPASITIFAARPSGVPAATASRSRSPVETWGTPWRACKRCACVPLPEPGAPSRTSLIPSNSAGLSARRGAPILPAAPDRVKPGRIGYASRPTGRSTPRQRDSEDGPTQDRQAPAAERAVCAIRRRHLRHQRERPRGHRGLPQAPEPHRQPLCRPRRHRRRADRRPDRHRPARARRRSGRCATRPPAHSARRATSSRTSSAIARSTSA